VGGWVGGRVCITQTQMKALTVRGNLSPRKKGKKNEIDKNKIK
jgi:hypothetical protein